MINDKKLGVTSHHLLNPHNRRPVTETDREIVRAAVQRLTGGDPDILAALGLTPDDDTKRCGRCGETKPRVEFPARANLADGRLPHCRTCHRANKRQYDRARYAQIGPRGLPGSDQNIHWSTATPGGRGVACTREAVAERKRRYWDLRDQGYTPRGAAEQMCISMRSARRFDAERREEVAA